MSLTGAKVVQNKGLSYVCHPRILCCVRNLGYAETKLVLYSLQRGQVERNESRYRR